MKNKEFVNIILEEHSKAKKIAQQNFTNLNYEQFNWKPAPVSWSVGECFAHLISTNKNYINYFEEALRKNSAAGEKEFKHSLMGRIIIKSVKPGTKLKTKTPEKFNPNSSSLKLHILNNYFEQHEKIHSLMEEGKNLDLSSIKITSPINSIVKYNMGDSFAVIAFHDQRHIAQAERVKNSPGFPRS